MRITASMISCRQRDAVRAETLAHFAGTDWGEDVNVVIDHGHQDEPWRRTEETFLRALTAAVETEAPFALILEDDVELNPRLRENLERWPPLLAAAARPGAPFFGSLFHCGQPVLWRDDVRRIKVAAPEGFWGAQALVLSRATAIHALRRWCTGSHPHDMQLPLIAAELSPLYFHTPSLVQQRDVPSTWGPGTHRSPDFDVAFVANGPATPSRDAHGSTHI
jgi:hypothetical protein